MATSWTDNPATSATHIRAVHTNELRSAVNQNRSALGLAGYPWTDNPVTSSTHIRSAHFIEIRSAAQDLWSLKRMGPLPNWSVGSPPASSRRFSARDVNDLRSWINQYENYVGPADPQGIVSFLYDPTPPATVTSAFCQDVVNLKPSGARLLIRAKVNSRASDNALLTGDVIQGYKNALAAWASQGFGGLVGGVLTGETERSSFLPSNPPPDPNAPLGSNGNGPLTNAYIDAFSSKTELLAQQLAPSGLRIYWVWNEPNVPGSALNAPVFGSMLYNACNLIKSGASSVGVSNVLVYAGSLSVLPGSDPNGQQAAAYLQAMYQYLNQNGVGGPSNPSNPYPWDALSLNLEGLYDVSFARNIFYAIRQAQVDGHDDSGVAVGEWGVQNYPYQGNPSQPFDPNQALATYNGLRTFFSTMYFFIHPALTTNNDHDYGTKNYGIDPNLDQYVLGSPFLWYSELQQLYPLPPP